MREGEIISLFMKHFERHSLGDDAGFIKLNNSWLLVTSDMLVWKTDVPDFMTPEDAGRKVVTMNVSDIAAMGGRPMAFFFSLAVPGDVSEDILRGIARGINEGSKVYKLKIVNGDTNEADDIIIDGGSLGIGKRLLLRSNAKPGDLVCVTGDLGRPLTALLLWMRGEKIPREIEEKARNPRARVEEGVKLSSLANSAIDISDGLSKELWEIANASNVRIIIEEERLPISDSVKEIVSDPVKVALASGEEFELLFTIPREKVEELDIDFKIIGRVEGGNGVYIKRGRKIEELEVLGWEHLAGGIDVEL